MKIIERRTVKSVIIALFIVIMGATLSIGHGDAQDNDATGPVPKIDTVEISIENQTDFIVIRVAVNGTSGVGTDHVNITAAVDNGTGPEPTIWIEETELKFFGNELKLKGTGSGDEEWSEWILRITLSISKSGNISTTLGLLGLIFGFDDIDTGGIPSDIGSIEDIGDVDLNETDFEIYLMARAISDNGTYGEDMVLITDDIITAVNDFLNPVIPVEDDDDVVEPEEEDAQDLSPLIVVGILLLGVGLVIGSVAVLLVIRKSSRDE